MPSFFNQLNIVRPAVKLLDELECQELVCVPCKQYRSDILDIFSQLLIDILLEMDNSWQ